jgi:hypothetical protein
MCVLRGELAKVTDSGSTNILLAQDNSQMNAGNFKNMFLYLFQAVVPPVFTHF